MRSQELLKYWASSGEGGLLLDILVTADQATEGDPSKLSQIYSEFFMHITMVWISLLSSDKILGCGHIKTCKSYL